MSRHNISIGNPEKHGESLKNAYISYELTSIIVSAHFNITSNKQFCRTERVSKLDDDTKISCG